VYTPDVQCLRKPKKVPNFTPTLNSAVNSRDGILNINYRFKQTAPEYLYLIYIEGHGTILI